MCKEIFEQKFLVPWDQIFNFWALTPNAGPTQTHAGCRWTPYGFLDHVEYVFLKDNFVVFQSILQRCVLKETAAKGYTQARIPGRRPGGSL